MTFDSHKHRRRSIRLKEFDYSQDGGYFVTICTYLKNDFFGTIDNGEMKLSPVGFVADNCWNALSSHFEDIYLDEFIVMPNHVHGLIFKFHDVYCRGVQLNAPTKSSISPQKGTLGITIRTFKAAVTTWCRKNGYEDFAWQRNYYEHIIRGEKDLRAIRNYIVQNPLKWDLDENNPLNNRLKKL